MDNAGYVALSRQAGLKRELNTIANNIANMSTNGFRREGAIFAEHVDALSNGDPSLSTSIQTHRFLDLSDGATTITGGSLDVALTGPGFFLVESPNGERLTRDGAFSLNEERELVNSEGFRVLDESGGAIVIAQNEDTVSISEDGSIFAGGQPIARLGIVTTDPTQLVRDGLNTFVAEGGFEALAEGRVKQGAIEGSNVNAIAEVARLIEVQRAYEATKKFSESENERISRTIRTLGQS